MVAPAFQWFRSRLVQNKYGDGGNSLNFSALSQLNGMTNDNMILLGSRTPKLKPSRSNLNMTIHADRHSDAGGAFKTGFKSEGRNKQR